MHLAWLEIGTTSFELGPDRETGSLPLVSVWLPSRAAGAIFETDLRTAFDIVTQLVWHKLVSEGLAVPAGAEQLRQPWKAGSGFSKPVQCIHQWYSHAQLGPCTHCTSLNVSLQQLHIPAEIWLCCFRMPAHELPFFEPNPDT